MPRFFVPAISSDRVVLRDENAAHITKSLRMKIGEIITLSDANGTDCEAELVSISSDEVTARVLKLRQNLSEPSVNVTLYQALPKVGKFETIVQKSVELGVTAIVPMLTSRCVSRPDENSGRKKEERYQKIAHEAAKQSGRGIVPAVRHLMNFADVLKELGQYDAVILFYEEGGKRIDEILPKHANKIAVLIGSEGGFSASEVHDAERAGALIGTLGPRILRCETAPIAALSIVMYETKNM